MWAAVAVVAVAYAYRSATRGWDFRPDAFELVVLAILAGLIVARFMLTRSPHDGDESDASA